MNLITLITDFGVRDAYVASMKGVILGINPRVVIVDVTHEIRPGNVREAAFIAESCCGYFPKKTVHVIVVDPGVGSQRKILCVKTEFGIFIAPDNGVLTAVIRRARKSTIREARNDRYFLKKVSSTFHGRDRMAPLAAYLSRKNIFDKVGKKARGFKRLEWPEPVISRDGVEGHVIHSDRFGNLITDIEQRHYDGKNKRMLIRLGTRKIETCGRCYSDGRPGKLMALINSTGRLEIAVPCGSAEKKTNAGIGDKVFLSVIA